MTPALGEPGVSQRPLMRSEARQHPASLTGVTGRCFSGSQDLSSPAQRVLSFVLTLSPVHTSADSSVSFPGFYAALPENRDQLGC